MCFVDSECINSFILSKEVLKSFLEFLTTALEINSVSEKNNDLSEFRENSNDMNKRGTKLGFTKLKEKLGDSPLGNIAQSLIDYKRLTDPRTKRNFFLFIDCNLKDSEITKRCTEEFIKALKDSDKLCVIRVKDGGNIETILSLTDCRWAKKNLDYIVRMVENPPYINYLTQSGNILDTIVDFFSPEKTKGKKNFQDESNEIIYFIVFLVLTY
jgi:hypothetical protein